MLVDPLGTVLELPLHYSLQILTLLNVFLVTIRVRSMIYDKNEDHCRWVQIFIGFAGKRYHESYSDLCFVFCHSLKYLQHTYTLQIMRILEQWESRNLKFQTIYSTEFVKFLCFNYKYVRKPKIFSYKHSTEVEEKFRMNDYLEIIKCIFIRMEQSVPTRWKQNFRSSWYLYSRSASEIFHFNLGSKIFSKFF